LMCQIINKYTVKVMNHVRARKVNNRLVRDVKILPILITTGISIYDAIVKMFLEDVGTLYVIDDEQSLAGVISRKDLLKGTMSFKDTENTTVSAVMTRRPNITMCYPDDLLLYVAKQIIDRQIDSLPVVKEVNNRIEVIGRITKTNITKVFVNLME